MEMVVELDDNGNIIWCNEMCEFLLGYMVEECCAEGSCAPVVLPKVA